MKYGITLGYVSKLNYEQTIEGIEKIKESLFENIKKKFHLLNVTSSLITDKTIWLNDDFRQTKRIIDFDILNQTYYGEIIIANNKWRRNFIKNFDLSLVNKKGIITNFNSVNRDIKIDNINSISVEEIGLEIPVKKKTIETINNYIIDIYKIIYNTDIKVSKNYEELKNKHFTDNLTFVTYKKLKTLYPLLNFNERLNKFGKEYGSFVLQEFVTSLLNQKDYINLSEDVFDFSTYSQLYIYNGEVERSINIGYISFQVDRRTLKEQNLILKENYKTNNEYNHLIKSNQLPLTISSGIYPNRITMTILEKAHIGEVHSSLWEPEFIDYCKTNGIKIL